MGSGMRKLGYIMGLCLLLGAVRAGGVGAQAGALAEALYAEGEWALCIRESRRALRAEPAQPRLRLLETLRARAYIIRKYLVITVTL